VATDSNGASSDADCIRAQLAALGLSQRDAARRLGIDDRAIRYYCAGKMPVPAVVTLALLQLEQMRKNDQCLALLADGAMTTSDGPATAERLQEANQKLRAAIELLLRPVRAEG
jgi:transcriptional regulator with XRE-family HTH domain